MKKEKYNKVMNDKSLLLLLHNVYSHLKLNYDFLMVIVGDTGSGKSMFGLHLLEMWYKIVLQKGSVDPELIKNVNTDYKKWVRRFKDLDAYDMNIYDEGATALDSKDAMSKLSKDLSKLFNVFRSKRFFSVIILPSFFNLNKYFRENRLRCVVWVDKRGRAKFFDKKYGVKYLNAYNERRPVKDMNRARPFLIVNFPDYKGILREPYEKMKDQGVDDILDEVIERTSTVDFTKDFNEIALEKVRRSREKGKTFKKISEELGISIGKTHGLWVKSNMIETVKRNK